MCESFNREILECRDKPIITLLEGIKHYLTKRITSQKELMNTYTGDICHKIQLLLEKNKKHAECWTPTWHGGDDLSIFGVTNGIETYSIDLKKQTCACRKWDLTGIPCSHVISCKWQNKKKPEDYVSEYYRKSFFNNSYSHIIYPTNGPQLWPLLEGQVPIKPPVLRRAIDRPKKLRNKVNDEPRIPHVLPRKLTTVSCHKCGTMRHNKRSCKGKMATERVILKGGNKKKGNTSKDGKRQKLETNDGKKIKTAVTEIGNSSQAPQPSQD
ncbi:unnamed protein product [Lathyrus sativus]|nr:unnamed protein product [Lathyrus sativus]